jgi:DNA-binding IclR family transcriptional regulator
MDQLSEIVRRLVESHIQSVAKLEVLLLLRQRPSERLTANQVAQTLYMQPSMMASLLVELVRSGLIEANEESPPRYQYKPRSQELGSAMDELATLYQNRRVAVVGLIHSAPSDQMRKFADAFRIRKDKQP